MNGIAPNVGTPATGISVVIPTYNGERYIGETIECLLSQDFQDFEVLLVDDGSTDGTIGLLEHYAGLDSRLRILRTPVNLGIVPKVLNFALPSVRGKYFVYSSQDDLYSTDWLRAMHERAVVTGAQAVVPELAFYNERVPRNRTVLSGVYGNKTLRLSGFEAFLLSLDWSIPGNALWDMDLVRRIGFFDFAMNADEYSVRVFFLSCTEVVFSDGIFFYRQGNPDAITRKISLKTLDFPLTSLVLSDLARKEGCDPEIVSDQFETSVASIFSLYARCGNLDPVGVTDKLAAYFRMYKALGAKHFPTIAWPTHRRIQNLSLQSWFAFRLVGLLYRLYGPVQGRLELGLRRAAPMGRRGK